MDTLLELLLIASTVIGYFISVALITTSFYKSRANNYLALSLFLMSSFTLLEFPGITSYPLLDIINNFTLDILFGATLFTYFLIQIEHTYLNSRWHKWIYFPFVCTVAAEISLLFLDLYGSIYDVLIFYIRDFASIGLNTFLIFWGRRLIRNSTTISKDKRHWLLRLNLFTVCLVILWILTRIEGYIFNSSYSSYVLLLGMSLFLWWVLYYGIFRLQVIAQKEEIHEYLVSKKTVGSRSKKKIKSTTSSKIVADLYKLMEEDELFKNPLLSRLELAEQLGTSESYLSQIVNQELHKSIIQFVNEYRIEAAKDLLRNPVFDKYSVEAIGLEAGFKSKSAFYNAFKTSLDVSPGAFRKLQGAS